MSSQHRTTTKNQPNVGAELYFLRRMELFVRSGVREVLNHIEAILIANQSDRSQAVGQGRAGQFAKTPPKCARGIVSLPQCRLCGASRTQVGHSATSAMCQCTKSVFSCGRHVAGGRQLRRPKRKAPVASGASERRCLGSIKRASVSPFAVASWKPSLIFACCNISSRIRRRVRFCAARGVPVLRGTATGARYDH